MVVRSDTDADDDVGCCRPANEFTGYRADVHSSGRHGWREAHYRAAPPEQSVSTDICVVAPEFIRVWQTLESTDLGQLTAHIYR